MDPSHTPRGAAYTTSSAFYTPPLSAEKASFPKLGASSCSTSSSNTDLYRNSPFSLLPPSLLSPPDTPLMAGQGRHHSKNSSTLREKEHPGPSTLATPSPNSSSEISLLDSSLTTGHSSGAGTIATSVLEDVMAVCSSGLIGLTGSGQDATMSYVPFGLKGGNRATDPGPSISDVRSTGLDSAGCGRGTSSVCSTVEDSIVSRSPFSLFGLEHLDVLIALHHRGIPLMVDQILGYLTDKDLVRCLLVCKDWNSIVSSRPSLMKQVRSRTEHLADTTKAVSKVAISGSRNVLASVANRMRHYAPSSSSSSSPSSSSSHNNLQPHYRHYTPCPKCQCPAKRLNARRAECDRCSFDFCQHCFKNWHESGDCRRCPLSPKRPAQHREIAGSRQSKKRLKRL